MVLFELRHALKDLIRRPRFALTVALTLAAVVGSGGALFSLLNAFVLRPLPVREPGRLVVVYTGVGEALFGLPGAMLTALQEQRDMFESVCGIARSAHAIELGGALSMHPSELMSSECASTLGVVPFMGRLIDESDRGSTTDAAPVVVVGYEFWRRALSADPNVIGRTLRVDGYPLTIVGVMPPAFAGLNVEQTTALTVPLGLLNRLLSGRSGGYVLAMHAVGRLKPDVTLQQAEARLRSTWTALWDANVAAGQGPSSGRDVTALRVEPFRTGLSVYRVRYRQPLQLLVGLSLMLILLASINVANLFLVRTDAREHEIAVQFALGAGHARVAWRLAAEALLLSCAGAALAMPLAWWLSRAIAQMLWTSIYPMTARLTPDGTVLTAIIAIALSAGMLLAAPSLLAARFRVGQLRSGEGRSVFSTTGRWRRALVVAQIASATVLLFSAGIFLRSLTALQRLDPGYPTDGLAWSALQRVPRAPGGDESAYAFEMIRRVSAVAGVRSAAMSSTFPTFDLRMLVSQTPLRSAATPTAPEIAGYVDRVSPAFFETAGITLLRGREFGWQDDPGTPRVAIVNTALADRMFPGGDALGQRIRVGAQIDDVTVIGIVGTVSPGDRRASALPILYQPLLQRWSIAPRLLVRADSHAGLLADLDRAVRPLGRHYVEALRTIDEQFAVFYARERAIALLSSIFACIGVLVGGVGIYAMLAHAVSRRTRELGVRLAIGATPARLVAMVLGEGGVLLIAGLVIGVPLAMLASRLAGSLLFDPARFDTGVLVAVVAGLAVLGAAASLLPALRAANLSPSQALRHE